MEPSKELRVKQVTEKEDRRRELENQQKKLSDEHVKIINMRRNAEIDFKKMWVLTERQIGSLVNQINALSQKIRDLK